MFRHLVQTATLPGPCPAAAAVAVTGTLVVNSGITVPGASDANAPALLGSPRGVVAGLFGPFTVFLGAISAGFVASLLATDLAMGTVRTQLIVHPRRPSLLAGKLSAVAAVLLLAALVAVLVAALTAVAVAPSWAAADGWYSMRALEAAAGTLATLWLAMLCYSAAGFVAAMLLRSPGPATIVGVLYVTSVDGLVVQLAKSASAQVSSWLLQPNIVALARGVGVLGRPLAVSVVFATALFAIGTATFVRRDVLS